MPTQVKKRYLVLSFFLGGLICTGTELLIRRLLPCGHHTFYEKQCPAPRTTESLERRGLSISGPHTIEAVDTTPSFALPESVNSHHTAEADAVLVPVAQDLDTNGDGVPDRPIVWELPTPVFPPGSHAELPGKQSVTWLWREMDPSEPSQTKQARSTRESGFRQVRRSTESIQD